MLNWAARFNICCFLDDSNYGQQPHSWDCLLAAGASTIFSPRYNILAQLKQFLAGNNRWLFGHIGYDLKNETEPGLHSLKAGNTGFPTVFLFEPEIVITVQAYTVVIHSAGVPPANVFSEILQVGNVQQPAPAQPVTINARLSRDEYIDIIKKLKAHIQRGDCYELNFCQEFYACPATINPLTVYNRLAAVSPAPFACFYRLYDKYLLCASPERYIKKTGSSIISQPMKGTAKRDPEDTDADEALKVALACSSKDQAENVMVVDLVRNDLAKICAEGSVYASRLFEIQTFPQVHQMVSTVSGTLLPAVDLSDVLQATFPMGSMTGAPKKRVLELVEQYENLNRGIFSGAVGYISPGNDFDFNVVIRSIMYNAATQYVSYIVGSGITFYSNEEKEYEECLLKALAMAKALS